MPDAAHAHEHSHTRRVLRSTVAIVLAVAAGVAFAEVQETAADGRMTSEQVARLQRDAAMMAAGIDADVRSIALARSTNDTLTLRDAEASLRNHQRRMQLDLSALTAAGITATSRTTVGAQTAAGHNAATIADNGR